MRAILVFFLLFFSFQVFSLTCTDSAGSTITILKDDRAVVGDYLDSLVTITGDVVSYLFPDVSYLVERYSSAEGIPRFVFCPDDNKLEILTHGLSKYEFELKPKYETSVWTKQDYTGVKLFRDNLEKNWFFGSCL